MKSKKFIIPTITMVIIASQMMGCGAVEKNELMQMLEKGEQIEIEVYTPDYIESEQGEERELIWEKLGLLEMNPELRDRWEDTLGIIGQGEEKNGILYIGEDGKRDINNTLRQVLHNDEFTKIIGNKDGEEVKELVEAVESNYVDIGDTSDIERVIAIGINGYFNLLPDSEPNYCNGYTPITRAEFMAMVYRAEEPVKDLGDSGKEIDAIIGFNEYNKYVIGVIGDSYLSLGNKGINSGTYTGNITRGEVIYLLMSRYFNVDLTALTTNTPTTTTTPENPFIDLKNGGEIVKESERGDYWESYELSYALKNVDQGAPERIYNAMLVAYDKGIIGTETRWDEACTRVEAIELLIKVLEKEEGIERYSAKLGLTDQPQQQQQTQQPEQQQADDPNRPEEYVSGPLDDEFATYMNSDDADQNIPVETPAPIEEIETGYEVVPMDPTTYYATTSVNLRQGPSADDFVKIGALSLGEEVTVVGEVKEYKGKSVQWYQLSTGEFASANYFSLEKPYIPEASNQGQGGESQGGQGGTSLGDMYKPGDVMESGATYGGDSDDLAREAFENLTPEELEFLRSIHVQ